MCSTVISDRPAANSSTRDMLGTDEDGSDSFAGQLFGWRPELAGRRSSLVTAFSDVILAAN
jgi:hypothetical protein